MVRTKESNVTPKKKSLVQKFYEMEPELREVANDLSDPLQPAVANVVRAIEHLHSIDAYDAAQVRPPLTPAKQAVKDQNDARDAAASRRHAAAAAEAAARDEQVREAATARRHEVLTKRAKIGRA